MMAKTKFIVSYKHPSNFYNTSYYPRTADRFRAIKVFNNENDALAFVAEAEAHNATDIKMSMHG